ncbi:MAG: hypothetical protein KBD83_00935 [Gammaproteobacteria bacterium]|nr:hypothetical protein [Gammaproteobacteria bacterium]
MNTSDLKEHLLQSNNDEELFTFPSRIDSSLGFNEKIFVLSLIRHADSFVFVIEGLRKSSSSPASFFGSRIEFLEDFIGEYSAKINNKNLDLLFSNQTEVSYITINEISEKIKLDNYSRILSYSYQINVKQAYAFIESIKKDHQLCQDKKNPRCNFLDANYFPRLVTQAQHYGWYAEKLKIAQRLPQEESLLSMMTSPRLK